MTLLRPLMILGYFCDIHITCIFTVEWNLPEEFTLQFLMQTNLRVQLTKNVEYHNDRRIKANIKGCHQQEILFIMLLVQFEVLCKGTAWSVQVVLQNPGNLWKFLHGKKIFSHNIVHGPRKIQDNLRLFDKISEMIYFQLCYIESVVHFKLDINMQNTISRLLH